MTRRGWRAGALFAIVASTVPTATHAATLEVLVRTDGGSALAGVLLRAEGIGGDAAEELTPTPGTEGRRVIRGRKAVVSGPDGGARFTDLTPGQYRVAVLPSGGSELRYVAPGDDPRHPGTIATLTGPLSHARVELVLTEGTPIAIGAKVFGGSLPRGGIPLHFQEATTGFRIEAMVRDGYHERVLAPGRWRLTASIPPGHLLVGLERQGQPLPGHDILLDLSGDPRSVELWWLLSAPCRIAGRVTGDLVPVEARLVEAGPWLGDARARGGFEFERVGATPDRQGWYEMVVPDGRWRVQPLAGEGAEVTPESVELTLAPGTRGAASFDVRGAGAGSGRGGGHMMLVHVDGPDVRARIEDARVELQRLGAGGEPERVIATRRTRHGMCVFERLAAGAYRAVVSHPDFLEGAGEATIPEAREPAKADLFVRLTGGGRIHVRVEPGSEPAPPRVAIEAEWLEEALPSRFRDEQNVAAVARRTASSDATGHAHLRGLWPGRWRLRARGLEGDRSAGLVRVGVAGGARAEELDVLVPAEGALELVAAVVPAARLELRLACDDGGPLPPTVDVRLLDPRRAESERERSPLRLALEGTLGDTLRVGPLEAGPWRVAVRPAGFDAETWLPAGEDRAHAEPVNLAAGETADAGILEVVCAPRLRIDAKVPAGAPMPDLGAGRVEAGVVRHAGGRREPWASPSIRFEPGAVILGGLPEGLASVDATLRHRHVLPGGEVSWSFPEIELLRGRIHRVSGPIPGVGGSIRLPVPVACVRALRQEAGNEAAAPVVFRGPDPEVGPLVPGVFAVGLAAEDDCDRIARRWSDVLVEPARAVELR